MILKNVTLRIFIVLGINDTSALVGHFVSATREREKRDRDDRRDNRRNEREGQEEIQEWSEETTNKNIPPPLLLPATRLAGLACPTVNQYQLDAPVTRHLPRNMIIDRANLLLYQSFIRDPHFT